jgi:hypothetical protein
MSQSSRSTGSFYDEIAACQRVIAALRELLRHAHIAVLQRSGLGALDQQHLEDVEARRYIRPGCDDCCALGTGETR